MSSCLALGVYPTIPPCNSILNFYCKPVRELDWVLDCESDKKCFGILLMLYTNAILGLRDAFKHVDLVEIYMLPVLFLKTICKSPRKLAHPSKTFFSNVPAFFSLYLPLSPRHIAPKSRLRPEVSILGPDSSKSSIPYQKVLKLPPTPNFVRFTNKNPENRCPSLQNCRGPITAIFQKEQVFQY